MQGQASNLVSQKISSYLAPYSKETEHGSDMGCTPIIMAMWEAEIEGSWFEASPGKKS
jgi:hypothetical protein